MDIDGFYLTHIFTHRDGGLSFTVSSIIRAESSFESRTLNATMSSAGEFSFTIARYDVGNWGLVDEIQFNCPWGAVAVYL